MLDPIPNLTCCFRCSEPFSPSAGCTVSTVEVAKEACISILSFMNNHPGVPVFVICDEGAHRILSEFKFPSKIFLRCVFFSEPDTVMKHNNYHRSDAILRKMEVLDWAVKAERDAVFFDADLTFLAPLIGPQDCEVALSHNLPCLNPEFDGDLHGYFNAGLVWTCNPKFAHWWRAEYLAQAKFYEQHSLNKAPRVFRCGYFHLQHKYGFWRGPVCKRHIKSIHIHLDSYLDPSMPSFMVKATKEMRSVAWRRIGFASPDLVHAARRRFDHPKRMFFVHYGKAGGVYTNEGLKSFVIPDYEILDSWNLGLQRDWTEEELSSKITTASERNQYLHQHHLHVTEEHISLAKERGWLTFSFLRMPAEIICSLFHWRQQQFGLHNVDMVFGQSHVDESFSEFWERLIAPNAPENFLWALPNYYDSIDEVAFFSSQSLSDFCDKHFHYTLEERQKMNQSKNPGLSAHRSNGSLTPDMIQRLEAHPLYQSFLFFCQRRSLTCPN